MDITLHVNMLQDIMQRNESDYQQVRVGYSGSQMFTLITAEIVVHFQLD